KPIETAERVFERNLWIEDAITTLPSWSRGVTRTLVDGGTSTRADAIRAFTEILATGGPPPPEAAGASAPLDPVLLDGLRAPRTVLLPRRRRLQETAGHRKS